MPQKCSVPGCRGNYLGGPKVSVFSFPSDPEQRRKWINAIYRKDFQPTSNTKVCERHFRGNEILRSISAFDEKKGQLITAPLLKPQLAKNVVPSQFPDCPSYMSNTPTSSHETPQERRNRLENNQIQKAIEDSVESHNDHQREISFSNFDELVAKVKDFSFNSEWNVFIKAANVHIVLYNEDVCKVVCAVKINSQLNATLFVNGVETKMNSINLPRKVNSLIELEDIVLKAHMKFASNRFAKEECYIILGSVINCLEDMVPEKTKMLSFVREQIAMSANQRVRKYSWEVIVFASLVYSISPHAYKFIRASGNLILPAPRTLKGICSNLCTNPMQEDANNFLLYVKSKVTHLSVEDKIVALTMDEVHVKPELEYKQGNIVGTAMQSSQCATGAYVFMINSLRSSYKDVVHIVPVATIDGSTLKEILCKVVIGLEEIGLEVLALATVNSAVNRRAVALLNDPPQLMAVFPHPRNCNRKLFFMFDAVHLLKCIRNNWLNAPDQKLIYPNIEGQAEAECVASFGSLKELHRLERNDLLKYGISLTLKCL